MATLTSLQTLTQQAIGNANYTAALITGHLNQGCRIAAGRVRLPDLAAIKPVLLTHPKGACTDGFTANTVIPIYSSAHGLVNGDIVMPSSIVGTTELNGKLFRVTKVDANNFTLDNTTYNAVEPNYTTWASAAISAIDLTGSDVAITTSTAHGLSTGDLAYFKDVDGTAELNTKQYTVTVTSTTAFTLDDTTPANYTAYAPAAGDNKVYSGCVFYKSYVSLPSDFDYYLEDNMLRVYSQGQDASFEYQGSPRSSIATGELLGSWSRFTSYYPVLDETGNILYMAVKGTKLYFHPMPSSDTLFMHYQRVPTAMSGGTDTPDGLPEWFHEKLVEYAAMKIFEEQGQLELMRTRKGEWEEQLERLQLFVGGPDVPIRYIEDEGDWYA